MSKNNTKVVNTTTENRTITNPNNTPKTTYVSISDNIYHDGTSYRVRMCINGTKHSKNFSSKRKAVIYRNQMLKG